MKRLNKSLVVLSTSGYTGAGNVFLVDSMQNVNVSHARYYDKALTEAEILNIN